MRLAEAERAWAVGDLRAAFSTGRLDAVMRIAGQLAVSLDNALVYPSLERKVFDTEW